MTLFSALLDTCVLVPATLADTLLRVAEGGLYRPLWSTAILDEMTRVIDEVHPDLPAGRAQRRAQAMDAAFVDASVSGWEGLVPAICLPDPCDRHVVAAAVVGRADVIITSNLKDFPTDSLAPYGIEAQNPDVFLLHQLALAPSRVMQALQHQTRAMRRPPAELDEVLARLSRCGVPSFAEAARAQKWRLESSEHAGTSRI
ncbi:MULTISPECIES: PIN domain-containing protein [unclassified Actinomyces]|uniref:PIN domain-containing protein n=1 Tax=unclassified Actinomyces TaxID=2609248 RepID=UPI002016E046|nr:MULTISPECIES: PIN domain-containing protein [unclassified Actinomyces]MCL3776564.1 PIN domain-containing protein [Actinomyces sp. AC-20-1]MCL3788850.1 PIN domain-containing protein [Actinomyces sp. 187325]MCL3791044.1 PIN domain-containing protein [Actinomyces sp. 186855]MCL3793430.1 PIN domain-containing protein [Actinomyces sp. 217892]